ncbi:MAG: KpsF/GutQ family sugar-phosphate isomerase [Nitrospinae bacterium]|nr:KpsF/GutQ family sugar-phosphate isomerase [Nitrospinota bacterium]
MESGIRELAINAALKVASEEARALDGLAEVIRSQAFASALSLCHNCRGALFILGMGKSGLVGQKMAATLTSTGTPSIYIHAGDALHGDLGAIRPGDVAILISKSGETREVLDAAPFLKKQGNPIIAITNDPASSLAKAASVTLLMGVESEACPLNLAPMTSTTVTMALGDALASALIVSKGFKPENFAQFHPGGKLGWMLTARVGDLLSKDKNPVCSAEDTLRNAVVKLVECRLGGVNIVDGGGRLLGVLTDGDIKRLILKADDGLLNRPVKEFMKTGPVTVKHSATAAEALDLMENRETQISVLPVVDDDNRPVGLLRLHDVIKSHL